MVRAQRAALDAADATLAMAAATDLSGTGENLCDSTLRECMMQKCGANFSKCIGDTDTTFFDKMDTCRRSTDCTGHEYQLFSAEIKADRDLNAKLATYNATIDCGNNYDACIMSHCGATYSKCIGKSAGDDAIARCESIARSCTEYDSGLAMRTMAVFGELRQTAERQIATDEQRLYALREQMRSVCTRLGAMFDERSLDCVYTVNFRAGDDNTLFASKKLYAGSTLDCTQNWFGVDITTFRENAFRTTRAQTSASSAMLGSGLGQAAGAITSGAIDRAVQRYRAENALDDAIKDCIDNGYDDNGNKLSEEECRAMKGYNSSSSDGSTNGSGTDSQTGAATSDSGDVASALTSGQTALNQGASTGVSTQQTAVTGNTEKAYDPNTGSFDVTVLDAVTKEPISSVQIGSDNFNKLVFADSTDDNGKLTVTLAKNVTTTLSFQAKGYDTYKENITKIPSVVHMTEGRAYSTSEKRLEGHVVEYPDRYKNIEGVVVTVNGNQEATTRDTGLYRIKDVDSDATITFTHNDYEPASYVATDVPSVVKLKKKGAAQQQPASQEEQSRSADFFDDDAEYADCNSDKDWYPLPRSAFAGPNEPIPYTYLGYGFHQVENLDDPEIREILTTLETKCRNSGGTFYNQQESMKSLNIQNVCGTYNKYQRVMCLYTKNIAPSDTCNKVFNMSTVTVEYDNDPNKPALSSGYNACNFKYKSVGASQRRVHAREEQSRSADFFDDNVSDAAAPTSDLFTSLMNKLQANKITVTSSNESNKIKMFADNSVSKDKNVKLGYPAVETAPSATGIKYYLHLDYPSLVNRTDNEHGAFCLELDKSICSGANSNCEVTYTGRSKCTFAYRL